MTNCTWPLQNHWTGNDGVLKITWLGTEQHLIREVQPRLSKRWPTCFGLFLSSFQSSNPSLWSNSSSLSNLQDVQCSSASVLLQSTLEGTFFNNWVQSGQGSSGGAFTSTCEFSAIEIYWAIDSTREKSFSYAGQALTAQDFIWWLASSVDLFCHVLSLAVQLFCIRCLQMLVFRVNKLVFLSPWGYWQHSPRWRGGVGKLEVKGASLGCDQVRTDGSFNEKMARWRVRIC